MIDAFREWAQFESTRDLAIGGFGLFAQALFFARWFVQWIATERRGISHIPVAFWWISLGGASLLAVYFILRREPIGLLGQTTGWIIYARNLRLIHRRNHGHPDAKEQRSEGASP